MARKKKDKGGGGGGAAWMNTYADMVTLLLCFFVLLYSFSSLDAQKFTALSQSLQNAFNIQPGGRTQSPATGVQEGTFAPEMGETQRPSQQQEPENSREVLALAQEAIKNEDLKDEIKVVVNERGVVISMSEQFLFDEGSARIHPEALRLLYKIGGVLNMVPNQVVVEGHTDSTPPTGSSYGDNWGLSSARAAAVTSYLNASLNVAADRLRAVGYGASSPLVPNDTPEHMRLNRRVDIVILSLHSVR